MMAEAQMGSPYVLTSYVIPDKISSDFKNVSIENLDEIDKKLEQAAKAISQNHSIASVYLSQAFNKNGKPITEEPVPTEVYYDMLIVFEDESTTLIEDVPI